MTDDLLVRDLRAQMHAVTLDLAPAPDLLPRVQRGARRSARRRAGVAVTLLAVVGAGLPVGFGDLPGTRVEVAVPAAGPAAPGPSDAELRAASWWTYTSTYRSVLPGESASTQRWHSADLRLLVLDPALSATAPRGEEVPALQESFGGFFVGTDEVGWQEVLDLPTDPAVLAERLRTPGGETSADRLFSLASGTLVGAPLLLPVREALSRVLAQVPGASVVLGTADSLGRPSTTVQRTDESGNLQVVHLDPVTARVLETATVAGSATDISRAQAPGEAPAVPPVAAVEAGDTIFATTYDGWGTTAPPAS